MLDELLLIEHRFVKNNNKNNVIHKHTQVQKWHLHKKHRTTLQYPHFFKEEIKNNK